VRARFLALAALALAPACSKSGAAKGDGVDAAPVYVSPDPMVEALWVLARDGGVGDDLARLADREGASGLLARASTDPPMRSVALRAMAYAPEPNAFEGLPLLAEAAAGKSDDDANAALDSAIDLAARPRTAVDREDREELRRGCDALLALAQDEKAARPRRVKAVRALRMFADAGHWKPTDPKVIPADLDAR
jgi:hypothetical protein